MEVDKLELLEKLFGEVFIPRAVFRELTANENFAEKARKVESATFFKVRDIADKKSLDIVHKISGLDLGESETIVLARELNLDFPKIKHRRKSQFPRTLNSSARAGNIISEFSQKTRIKIGGSPALWECCTIPARGISATGSKLKAASKQSAI